MEDRMVQLIRAKFYGLKFYLLFCIVFLHFAPTKLRSAVEPCVLATTLGALAAVGLYGWTVFESASAPKIGQPKASKLDPSLAGAQLEFHRWGGFSLGGLQRMMMPRLHPEGKYLGIRYGGNKMVVIQPQNNKIRYFYASDHADVLSREDLALGFSLLGEFRYVVTAPGVDHLSATNIRFAPHEFELRRHRREAFFDLREQLPSRRSIRGVGIRGADNGLDTFLLVENSLNSQFDVFSQIREDASFGPRRTKLESKQSDFETPYATAFNPGSTEMAFAHYPTPSAPGKGNVCHVTFLPDHNNHEGHTFILSGSEDDNVWVNDLKLLRIGTDSRPKKWKLVANIHSKSRSGVAVLDVPDDSGDGTSSRLAISSLKMLEGVFSTIELVEKPDRILAANSGGDLSLLKIEDELIVDRKISFSGSPSVISEVVWYPATRQVGVVFSSHSAIDSFAASGLKTSWYRERNPLGEQEPHSYFYLFNLDRVMESSDWSTATESDPLFISLR